MFAFGVFFHHDGENGITITNTERVFAPKICRIGSVGIWTSKRKHLGSETREAHKLRPE